MKKAMKTAKAGAGNNAKTTPAKGRGRGKPFQPGNAYAIKPGERRNPNGRPRNLLSHAYHERLGDVCEHDIHKRTYAELIAAGQIAAAIRGETQAAKEIADRTEGKAKESIEISGKDGEPVEFNLHIHFVDGQIKND